MPFKGPMLGWVLVVLGALLVVLAGSLVYLPLGIALAGGALIAAGLVGVPVDRGPRR